MRLVFTPALWKRERVRWWRTRRQLPRPAGHVLSQVGTISPAGSRQGPDESPSLQRTRRTVGATRVRRTPAGRFPARQQVQKYLILDYLWTSDRLFKFTGSCNIFLDSWRQLTLQYLPLDSIFKAFFFYSGSKNIYGLLLCGILFHIKESVSPEKELIYPRSSLLPVQYSPFYAWRAPDCFPTPDIAY